MPTLSKESKAIIATCHRDIRVLCNAVIQLVDYKAIYGWRGREDQNRLKEQGFSKLSFPFSRHNYVATDLDEKQYQVKAGDPFSKAIDWAPWYRDGLHVRWGNERQYTPAERAKIIQGFCYVAGHFMAIGKLYLMQGIITHDVRWGGDWNQNQDRLDETFDDLGHIELVDVERKEV